MEKLNFECDGIKYSENWLYRGEGNAHLALSLPSLRKVLIFKKQNPQEAGDASESFLKSIAFQNKIMKHLFGIYVTRIERVEFLDDLMSFKSQLDGLRPGNFSICSFIKLGLGDSHLFYKYRCHSKF